MAKSNLLNTGTATFQELISSRVFRVPPYQRDSSWATEQWEDLWNDILESRGGNQDPHYMGAVVLEGTTTENS